MKRSLVLLASVICAACATTTVPPQKPAAPPAPKATLGQWGVDLSDMDRSVKPGNNFFDYVNGTWLKTAAIPADRSSTGSFQDLAILSEDRMKAIVATLAAKPYDQLTPDEKKLRDLYDAFLDQKQIDSRGLEPVKADLGYLAHLKTHRDVARAMGSIKLQIDAPYNLYIGVDDKNPDAYSVNLMQGGLGLPDRDYYLRDDKALVATREAYRKYLATMLAFTGDKHTEQRAERVYALELAIAKAEWPNAERRDATKTYNPMTVLALEKYAPQFPWAVFLKEADIPLKSPKGERKVIIAENTAFPKLAKIFAETPVPVWRDYLTVHFLSSYAPYLPKKIDEENFAFYGKVVRGNTQQLPRATRGVHLLDGTLGFALGKLYVAKYFPPQAKAKAQALVANLLKTYAADIQTLDWMTPETRKKALEKLAKFTPYIGYPDKWRDYSAYDVTRNDLVGDIERGARFEWNRRLKRLDQPVDKSEWDMTPQTVNAYYDPTANKIVFPAAILQPPFFDANADDAVNYGGIGAVIGHEISHGFDDQGSKYNGDGKLENWWTPTDRKNFEARVSALGKQYDSYEPLPGVHINGAFTMGENIADLAGLTIAYKAYHLSLDGKPAPVLDGYTGDQRFFLSYAQIWRGKYRDGALRAQLLSNEHSPGEFRAIGATRNLDAWYKAFDVQSGQKYYLAPDQRVRLW
ncbi:MAG: M13 family metallopeptidase [Alphaproteobacteria bacterium]|nr:M13 family metallopeptidase [Alphaproteobacteria bacterium]MBU6471757.1 M13 family metallopeptidase [Alphaproteobacteria bacterium]MDE2011355.1 M13 family metallopeptidase [Alphaproteobacteria bacterium]MDE2072875.1 M13 family metallopeptidase [Alphaproteobacteria bacterium]